MKDIHKDLFKFSHVHAHAVWHCGCLTAEKGTSIILFISVSLYSIFVTREMALVLSREI